MKEQVYDNNPQPVQALKENIEAFEAVVSLNNVEIM